eukprot:4071189-Alexandrium_andersonii.AAC.1
MSRLRGFQVDLPPGQCSELRGPAGTRLKGQTPSGCSALLQKVPNKARLEPGRPWRGSPGG